MCNNNNTIYCRNYYIFNFLQIFFIILIINNYNQNNDYKYNNILI